MDDFFDQALLKDSPIVALSDFLKSEKANETAKKYSDMRFVGYVMEIGYDKATIITADSFKVNVGGVPRNSLLIMAPAEQDEKLPPHFTLLRVLESAPTPLTKEVQQTYFELQKKSMPELDVFTQSELQWGALKAEVLGMYYTNPDNHEKIEFSGDLNNFVSAHKYRVYAPNDKLLDLIINALVPEETQFTLGQLRLTENRLPLESGEKHSVSVKLAVKDLRGSRTAMFGKTRLGKSNIVKLIAESMIIAYPSSGPSKVGQLIFDINGEYANDNEQDGNKSIASKYKDESTVYAMTPKPRTPSKRLKLNFYEQPARGLRILASLLEKDGRDSIYLKTFYNVDLPTIDEVNELSDYETKKSAIRKVQTFWAILKTAGGYDIDQESLRSAAPFTKGVYGFTPGLNEKLRVQIYGDADKVPDQPTAMDTMTIEYQKLGRYLNGNPDEALIKSLDGDMKALLGMLVPRSGSSGSKIISPYRDYHDKDAGHYAAEIIDLLDKGKTVILDLGNADEKIMEFFSDELSREVAAHQVEKFSAGELGDNYVQIYFEEAHNLFPATNTNIRSVYNRFAKEGAKYHIGMVYSTQSPTTISKDLLAQTENFFVAHLSSREEVDGLAKLNVAFESVKEDILSAKTKGYVRMLTQSNRFTVPVQAKLFTAKED